MSSIYRPDVLAGKRILITGGGTGLGRIMATALAAHGATVHLWGRRDAVLREAADAILAEHGPGTAHVQAVNIRDAESVDAAMQQIWDEHGPLTGVINNAAANFIAPTKDLSPRGYEAVNSTVMDGSFYTTHAAGRRWIAAGLPGSVLSMLTTWVWSGSAFVTASAMGKAAVHAMTMSLAVEWGGYGIRVNALAPGPIPTEYAGQMLTPPAGSAVGATQADTIPMGRHGKAEELENLVIFMMSDACDYLTGATIPMDGGQRLAGPGTFAGLTKLDDAAWAEIREQAKAATAQTKTQRTTT
jgi:NAD(P)-dependent dehydrogenase (short-subunit alcohol dehydrogenase family)